MDVLHFWKKIRKRYQWTYVGTVDTMTIATDNGKEEYRRHGRIVLLERGDGKRKQKTFGNGGRSEYAISQEAACYAWIHGGPLPKLYPQKYPPPKVPKSEPPSSKADLILFPGGKKDE